MRTVWRSALYTQRSPAVPYLLGRSVLRRHCGTSAVLSVPEEEKPTISTDLGSRTPRETVEELNKHIIGQEDGKKSVAIAMRNRWRRKQISDTAMKEEIIPRNILMIGPTGCGKTEIARRLAKLANAPFIKVEATKFTEVGFHGRDVDSIIRDLVDAGIAMTRKQIRQEKAELLKKKVEDKALDYLLGQESLPSSRENFRRLLQQGELDDREIEFFVHDRPAGGDNNNNNNSVSFQDLVVKFQNVASSGQNTKGGKKVKMALSKAMPIIADQEMEGLVDEAEVMRRAIEAVEQDGIVFLDEIDKIVDNKFHRGPDASSTGVQRDLLPLIEGTTISTKHGNVNTDYILFIASGAFHSVKPSDLLPELQGRLPIRVELKALTEDDLFRVLTGPSTSLLRQQEALLATEGVKLVFPDETAREIARRACKMNTDVENIGARRLHTVIEKVMEELSFEASEKRNSEIVVSVEMVDKALESHHGTQDLKRFIL